MWEGERERAHVHFEPWHSLNVKLEMVREREREREPMFILSHLWNGGSGSRKWEFEFYFIFLSLYYLLNIKLFLWELKFLFIKILIPFLYGMQLFLTYFFEGREVSKLVGHFNNYLAWWRGLCLNYFFVGKVQVNNLSFKIYF